MTDLSGKSALVTDASRALDAQALCPCESRSGGHGSLQTRTQEAGGLPRGIREFLWRAYRVLTMADTVADSRLIRAKSLISMVAHTARTVDPLIKSPV